MRPLTGPRLTGLLCTVEVLTMLGFSAYAVLLWPLRDAWDLTNAQAGWIGGAYFAGYTVAVPVLVTLTDRMDARRIWLAGALLAVTGNAGFAAFADGFWSAVAFHALAGAGLAGTYMPGLRLLTDRMSGRDQSRAVGFYTASFGIGTAASYLIADWVAEAVGWRAAFAVPAGATLLAMLLVLMFIHGSRPPGGAAGRLLDFRPVLRNRNAIVYSIAYFSHSFELYTVRAWIVAFLTFAGTGSAAAGGLAAPANVAFGMALLGIGSIVMGSESAIRFGRKRTVRTVMAVSAGTGVLLGATHGDYSLAVLIALVYGMLLTAESAALTAGAIGNAAPGQRGATIAVHSMIGFAGGIFGPAIFGWVLDLMGGAAQPGAWIASFCVLAAVTLVGPALILMARPAELPGDGRSGTRSRR
ncbi:MAG: MFS transporter [Alphaproteobacteria bacterium]